ncbi:MAG: NAD-binding of NADP-dependent 3-hydroxyisobutyrate dehydrogenase family protein [Herminiimonas sp.]|nr:NAD-binding of NADP-dependent 3-hydroxyisobutyrate dehydrogenase family protein [Herminiimonas sp.]
MALNQVAFIGLGRMGVPMAANLLRAGIAVRGFDLAPNAGPELETLGTFTRAASAVEAARGSDLVILMLPDSKVVDALLWQGAPALAQALDPGALVVDMSSSDPMHSRDNAARLADLGLGFLDAPVSGGVKRAVDGSLSIMVGGEAAGFERATAVLQAMGKTIIHVGSAGAGHAVKALNNYVSASGLIAVSEALVAAEAFGIAPQLVNKVFNASTGKNNTTEHKVENFMLSGRYDSGFALSLMRKDVQTAADFITGMQTPNEFVQKCLAVATAAEQGLEPGADHTAVHKWVRRK